MINCTNSRYIVHPKVRQWLLKYKVYCLNGVFHETALAVYGASFDNDFRKLWSMCSYMTDQISSQSFVIDSESGQTFPIFLEVPCGHCALCRQKKINNMSFRAQAETNYWFSQGASSPLFVTLTYNNTYVPQTEDGSMTLDPKDVTLFLKRLRQNLTRRYGCDVVRKLRYILCGEYGKNTHRPHYHILFWNFPNLGSSDNTRNLVSCLRAIEDSWSVIVGFTKDSETGSPIPHYAPLGFCSCYEVTSGASSYVCKYIGKSNSSVPEGCAPQFIHRSCGKLGGIGLPWLNQWLIDNQGVDIFSYNSWKLEDPYTGSAVSARFLPAYFVKKVAPSSSSLISAKTRYYLLMLDYCFGQLSSMPDYCSGPRRVVPFKHLPSYIPDAQLSVFRKFDYTPHCAVIGPERGIALELTAYIRAYGYVKTRNWIFRKIDYITSWLNSYDFDLDSALADDDRRSRYYARLSPKVEMTPEDLNYINFTTVRNQSLASLRETL